MSDKRAMPNQPRARTVTEGPGFVEAGQRSVYANPDARFIRYCLGA
jgi:hypothetical protein